MKLRLFPTNQEATSRVHRIRKHCVQTPPPPTYSPLQRRDNLHEMHTLMPGFARLLLHARFKRPLDLASFLPRHAEAV